MLIPEAVSLVIQAGAMGCGGDLFVLDMGEQVVITEMAELLIRLYGYEPYKDIKITFTGIKLSRELDPARSLKRNYFMTRIKFIRLSIIKYFQARLGRLLMMII